MAGRDFLTRAVRRLLAGPLAEALTPLATRVDEVNHLVAHVDGGLQQAAARERDRDAPIHEHLEVLAARQAHILERLDGQRSDAIALAHTLAAIADQVAWLDPPEPAADGPLVSVVCPVRNRAALFERALASVRAQTYPRWELLVVDDGSDDIGAAALERWQSDERVRVERIERRGSTAARNRALADARGEIVAYLDADNTFHPTYLARVVDTFDRHPDASWSLAAQLIEGDGDRPMAVRHDRHPVDSLATGNFVDLNAVAHRRSLLDQAGPFDVGFARLGDWDLAQRFAAVAGEPARIAALGSTYRAGGNDRISATVPLHPHHERMRARGRGRPAEGLRVLAAEWHYPQVSEMYVRSDIVGLQTLGAHVEAWSQDEVAVAYEPDLPVHRGDLADAIAAVRPHIVLTHWLHKGAEYRATTAAAGVPLAVRGHGFDHDHAVIDDLLDDPAVAVHLFPHLAATRAAHPRLLTLPVAFDQDRFAPAPGKDRRLVVRTGVALDSKDYDGFFAVAERCPDHRFVLVLCHAYLAEEQLDGIVARRDARNAPVEIVVDLPPVKTAELVAEAGIYLHTHGTDVTYGMSVSIAEAMGTGCYVLARDLPGMAKFLGDAGDLYRDPAHAAALVQQTRHWDDQRWNQVWHTAADRAHVHFGAAEVAATMLDQWRDALGVRAPG
jgi:glycosyltransferase involved in cell wall biosynthesis